jgi:hypothetical protein
MLLQAPAYLVTAVDVISDAITARYPNVESLTGSGKHQVTSLSRMVKKFTIAGWTHRDERYNLPQFVYQPLGLKMSWHRTTDRGAYTNVIPSREETLSMLAEVICQILRYEILVIPEDERG